MSAHMGKGSREIPRQKVGFIQSQEWCPPPARRQFARQERKPTLLGAGRLVPPAAEWKCERWSGPGKSLGCKKSWRSTLKRTLTNHCLVKSP
uniref:Uncharacterized protein n=1 Tax=Knipowitschia caucasica TaxID=637954 RepID=A0AAV2J5C0_KNICA